MIEDIEKFGVLWIRRDAKTNTLYTIQDDSLYNSCNVWFMLVQDRNNITQYLAFHNTSKNKAQIVTNIRTSTYSQRQKLYEIDNISLNKGPNIPEKSRTDYDTIFDDKNLYAIPEQYIDIIGNIDPNMVKYVEKFKKGNKLKQQDSFLLSITADKVESTDEEFTMDNLSLGDNFKPIDVYFQAADGNTVSRNRIKGEKKISNQTMPRIAFQIFEKQISNMSLGDKEKFPICRYSLNSDAICGIYSSVEEFRKHRKTLEYMQYKYDNNKQFVIYCWNIFSTIIFVQECLKRFGNQGDKFVLNYTKKDKNEIELEKKESLIQEDYTMKNTARNLVLYGPPGTGKTYSIKEYIDSILGDNPGLKADNEDQRISDVVKSLNWYSAVAISMYRNGKNNKYKVANMQHQKLIKAFAQTKDNNNLRAIIWGQLQTHTATYSSTVNYGRRMAPFIFDKTEDSDWYLTEEGIKFVEENLSEQLELLDAKNKTREKEDFYKFITFHQSYSYEEFVEGIKPVISDDEEYNTISYEYNKGIFKEICQKANSDPNNKYLLIIDEINRGNISKIFGELITLIETDKRVTPNGDINFENTKIEEDQLLVTLPYTKSKFGVPSNLYILGTMNTSDRSIASIDIALRRRFIFKEIMPNVNLVPDVEVFGIELRKIFTTLNERISILLDRDHQIGHSYFMKLENSSYFDSDFKRVWYDCVMPLLNEYFYGDWEKLCALLGDFQPEGKSFIKKINNVKFANSYSCDEDETYDFVSEANIDFEEAIKNAFKNI